MLTGKRSMMEHHFTPDQARNIYSHTKSYMSTAVGLAIADGKLSLDDRLAEFFPEAVRKMHSRSCLKFVCVIFL